MAKFNERVIFIGRLRGTNNIIGILEEKEKIVKRYLNSETVIVH